MAFFVVFLDQMHDPCVLIVPFFMGDARFSRCQAALYTQTLHMAMC